MSYGILAVGECLGEPVSVAAEASRYLDDPRRITASGYRGFHRAPDSTGVTDLAAEAGRRALARAGLRPSDVDLVVLAINDLAEYLYWDPATVTAEKIGVRGPEALLVNQACVGGVTAFDAAAGKFATHPGHRVVLLVAATRVCEPYWNRMDSSLALMSDGAAAAVLLRDHPRCTWLGTEVVSDGRYADISRLEVGGAAEPFRAGGGPVEPVENPVAGANRLLGNDIRAVIGFVRYDRERAREVVERACARAGRSIGQIEHLLGTHGTAQAIRDHAELLGVPLERTSARVAADHGHFGCADQVIALGRLLDSGRLRPGDLVALSGNGTGMNWACTLLRA
jgi:3-oxoacyl-[acyl-carrier-protein] synthase-3